MAQIKQATVRVRTFFMVDAGLTVVVSLSKNGGAFAPADGVVSELSDGWYAVALAATDTDTLGDLAIFCTEATHDPVAFDDEVVGATLDDIYAKVVRIPASPASVGDIPTAVQNADALLKRDLVGMTGEAARSPLNALRSLRNKVAVSSTDRRLAVYKEDDITEAWAADVTTDASLNNITSVEPA